MVAMSSGLMMESNQSRNLPNLLRHITSLPNPSPAPSAASTSRSISLASVSSEGSIESGAIDPDDVLNLTKEVRSFKDSLGKLRKVIPSSEKLENIRIEAHEKLADVLKVLRFILEKYPALQSTDLLVSAGTLIHFVKSYNFDNECAEFREFYETVDQLSQAFSARVSEYLMGDLETVAPAKPLSQTKSQVLKELPPTRESSPRGKLETLRRSPASHPEDLDALLLSLDQGVEIALHRAKLWSRHAREIASFVERRTQLEIEHAKALSKLAQGVRASLKQDSHLAFQSIYITALDQEIDNATTTQATCALLSGHKFVEPLTSRRSDHEKCRKFLKEAWRRELKRMQEAVANMRKAQAHYIQKQVDWEKAKEASLKAENSEPDGNKTEKRRKTEDEAMQKALESETAYKGAVTEANERHTSLILTKRKVLQEVRDLMIQGDQTLKTITVAYFQLQQATSAAPPVQYQTLCETSRLYEVGSHYTDFLRRFATQHREGNPTSQQNIARPDPFTFEPYVPERSLPNVLEKERTSRGSLSMESSEDSSGGSSSGLRSMGSERVAPPFTPINAWEPTSSGVSHVPSGSALYSDTESVGSSHSTRSRDGSPPASPMMPARRLVNTSQDEIEVETETGDTPQTPEGVASERHSSMSKAACSHTFKKLKTPARCRECDSYVYFQGAECIECGLASHKKCLEFLAIQCGHKRLPRKMTTFGVDLAQHLAEVGSGPIPRLLIRCVNEIEARGLQINGLYRVSGVKSKVEKLCQAFENGADLVDMTEIHPNIIANVLKLYLRQLPEPLLTSKLYPEFVRLAKDCSTTDNLAAILEELRELCRRLPKHHLPTLSYLMRHLKRVAEHSEGNKMPPSNLGIVFGPTLLRTAESATLNCLIDTVQQSRVIELLITHCDHIFGCEMPQERLIKAKDEQKTVRTPKRSSSFNEKKKTKVEEVVLPGFVVEKPKTSSSGFNESNSGLDDQRSSPSSEEDIIDYLNDEAIPFRRSPKSLKGSQPPKIFRSSLRDYHGLEGGSLNLLGSEERSPDARKHSSASQPGTPHQKLSFEFPPRSTINQSGALSKSKSSLSSIEDAPKSASSIAESSIENEPIVRHYAIINHERRNQFFGITSLGTSPQSASFLDGHRLSAAEIPSTSPSPSKSNDDIFHSAEELNEPKYDSKLAEGKTQHFEEKMERKLATVTAPNFNSDENKVKIQVPGLHIHNIPVTGATIHENYKLQKSLSQLSASDLKTKYSVVSVGDKPETTVLDAAASSLYRFRTEASRLQRTSTDLEKKMSDTKNFERRVEKFV
ncbi:rho GTPase-activating protein 45-like [Artemia franciscana]|uniref:rho GTPase-activating protein 45-like n=1 Tax=Artemia franciscana TaxID=6661 RepID=UPI0032DB4B2F